LIWINRQAPEIPNEFSMTRPSPPPIRHCPLCGVAMQASKSQKDGAEFDTFRCLTCDTTIVGKAQPPAGPD